ncbi:MAG: Clp1/GlmU family protein [Acidilobus sp.]
MKLSGCTTIRGPAMIAVSDGGLKLMGGPVTAGSSITVPVGRAVIVEGDGEVEISGGQLGQCDPDGLKALESLIDELRGARRVVLVGPTDSGKSTLAAYLYNSGAVNSIISTDVGQNEVYCPGFEALSMPPRPFTPGSSAPEPLSACLVGDYTPRGLEARYLACAIRLSRLSGSFVVDTDGWASGEGAELKAALALAVGADAVVAIGLDQGSLSILRHEMAGPLVVAPRLAPAGKSQAERRTNRDRLLASCMMGSRRRVLSLDGLLVEGREPEAWEGLLVGLRDAGGDHFAVVERGPSRSGSITVLTQHMGSVEFIRLGRARVDLKAFGGLLQA